MRAIVWMCLALFAAHVSAGDAHERGRLGRRFHEAVGASAAQMQQAQPALQEHASQLQGIAARLQGQGLAQLPQAEQALESAQTNLNSAVAGILDPANLDKLQSLHQETGEEMRSTFLDGTASNLLKNLKATAGQAEALKPLVTTQLDEMGKLFSSAWKTGGLEALPELQKSIEAHQQQFDAELAKVLTKDQMATFQDKRGEVLKRFEGKLGSQDVAQIAQQLGDLGEHKDEIEGILQDGFKAKADRLKAAQGDVEKQLRAAGADFKGVDDEVRNQIQGVLGDEAAQKVGQVQDQKRQRLRSRLKSIPR